MIERNETTDCQQRPCEPTMPCCDHCSYWGFFVPLFSASAWQIVVLWWKSFSSTHHCHIWRFDDFQQQQDDLRKLNFFLFQLPYLHKSLSEKFYLFVVLFTIYLKVMPQLQWRWRSLKVIHINYLFLFIYFYLHI